ncbi:heat-inducible transcription repressor [Actinidia rufa]|uniref:Heat-inducible transcription repressor n=1 Tax=Actinidia rufa TaxID=165716 RepID=A0A7J0DDN2_9ERIC|nr:heat-inducible transcription repressor [Actinidia rufa]
MLMGVGGTSSSQALFTSLYKNKEMGARIASGSIDLSPYGVTRRVLGAIRKLKTQSESSLLATLRSAIGEKILEVDGTVTSQPVLQHVGISTWPGRLILTDHALYFEALRVVSYDKAKRYDLSEDLKQVVKPELTGPWGTRLFDKAVLYKSVSLSEPVVMEFPELKGHTRRDYWLAIIREILYVHRFINKFQITGVEHDEALLKATLGIVRVQALKEISSATPICYESLLMFNLCDQLPGGDLVLEALAKMSSSRALDRTNSNPGGGIHSVSALSMASNLGFMFGTTSNVNEAGLCVGEITVGERTPLERAVKESITNHKKVVLAQATVDGVKVDGIDTNLAVMKELLSPVTEVGKWLLSLAYWEDSLKSSVFCLGLSYIIFSQGSVDELKVIAPPALTTVEQLLAVQNAISQAEELIQDGNIVLLKSRALLLSIFPQASAKFAVALLVGALMLAFLPSKYIVLLIFLETFTQYSPLRKASTERWTRRLREWWFSIPAAPVFLERAKEDKKRK